MRDKKNLNIILVILYQNLISELLSLLWPTLQYDQSPFCKFNIMFPLDRKHYFRYGKSFSILRCIIRYVQVNKIQNLYHRNDYRNNSNWGTTFCGVGMQSLLEEYRTQQTMYTQKNMISKQKIPNIILNFFFLLIV